MEYSVFWGLCSGLGVFSILRILKRKWNLIKKILIFWNNCKFIVFNDNILLQRNQQIVKLMSKIVLLFFWILLLWDIECLLVTKKQITFLLFVVIVVVGIVLVYWYWRIFNIYRNWEMCWGMWDWGIKMRCLSFLVVFKSLLKNFNLLVKIDVFGFFKVYIIKLIKVLVYLAGFEFIFWWYWF